MKGGGGSDLVWFGLGKGVEIGVGEELKVGMGEKGGGSVTACQYSLKETKMNQINSNLIIEINLV